jgi:diadenosine tetraphosphate (Ap4A) HIT family hydrolase
MNVDKQAMNFETLCDFIRTKMRMSHIYQPLLIKSLIECDNNLGYNCGEVAGQTVFHSHLHLIPRRPGDMDHPEGGVRGVIPGKMKYGSLSLEGV